MEAAVELREYLDLAKQRQGLRSDRQLCFALGRTQNVINQWLRHSMWPAEETMLQLAELAGVPAERALLDLMTWRATPKVRGVVAGIAAKLAAAGSALLLLAVLAPPSAVNAAGTGTQTKVPPTYYAK